MSKELESLENIKHYDNRVGLHESDYDIIETALKALEILKDWFEVFEDKNGYHLRTLFNIGRISKEEYELLKEVLND